jgi:hypothetical protein
METLIIPHNSALAIIDRALKAQSLIPRYVWEEYIDTITKEKAAGILLEGVDEYTFLLSEDQEKNLGVLGFVNEKEPGDGSFPLQGVFPAEGDSITIAYIIQGIYRGDFHEHEDKEKVQGLFPIINKHKVQKEDLEEKPYTLPVHNILKMKA